MSSELITVAPELEAYLKSVCPPAWRVVNAETLGSSKTSGIVLSYEQLDVSLESLGQELPPGWLWVTFQLVLSAPETEAVKALARLMGELSTLLQVLDASEELRWGPDATRTRLTTGETAFVIPIAFLASNTPPTPEPAISPDDSEEE